MTILSTESSHSDDNDCIVPATLRPKTIANRWTLGKIIGRGGFGDVFDGTDCQTGDKVAVKIELAKKVKLFSIEAENDVYEALKNSSANLHGFAKVLYFGREGVCNALVMTLLGYAHQDVTPQNFLTGGNDSETIYLVDFGVSQKMSSHGALETQGFDLHCLGIALVMFFTGEDMNPLYAMPKTKASTTAFLNDVRTTCTDFPELLVYFEYIHDFESKNFDYKWLRDLFETGLAKRGWPTTPVFDWMEAANK